MNFNRQYISSVSQNIIISSVIFSVVTGLIFFPDPGMISLFVITFTLISATYGEELLFLFAGDELKLKIQIGDIGIAFLKLTIKIFDSKGEITNNEIDKIEKYMSSEFDKEIGLSARNFIHNNKFRNYTLKSICRKLYDLKHAHKLQFIYQLFALVYTEKEFQKKEEKVIFIVSNELHINIQHYENIKSMFLKSEKKQSQQSKSSFYSSQKNDRKLKNFFSGTSYAYMELSVSPNISNDELKTAYRKLAKKYHPDKWIKMKDLEQKKAKEKFQKINNAYNLIKKARNL